MLEEQLRQQIIALVKREVIPAVGCTEPIAIALAVASSQSLLNGYPSRIHVALSPNMLKNAMGVGIPGTGMTGLPIAIALGAICGDSKANLEVLAKVTPDDVAKVSLLSTIMQSRFLSLRKDATFSISKLPLLMTVGTRRPL